MTPLNIRCATRLTASGGTARSRGRGHAAVAPAVGAGAVRASPAGYADGWVWTSSLKSTVSSAGGSSAETSTP
ncbi:hypothetical protein GCM10017589_34780 [Streptomyces poonensis]|nr:hypothetical protein GCM10017589_34780 [Streptomyces poonensis]